MGAMHDVLYVRVWLQGLGDLAAHLVAFHNMGASPSHDDPFVSGGKVSFDDEGPPEGGDGGQSPHAHNSQAYDTSPLLEQDRAFDGSDRVRQCHLPLGAPNVYPFPRHQLRPGFSCTS